LGGIKDLPICWFDSNLLLDELTGPFLKNQMASLSSVGDLSSKDMNKFASRVGKKRVGKVFLWDEIVELDTLNTK